MRPGPRRVTVSRMRAEPEADMRRPPASAPAARLLWLEQRAILEVGALVAASPLLRRLGRGDRHPVLVLPGFGAGDLTTVALRWHLRSWGYWAHGWGQGVNLGPTPAVHAGVTARLLDLHERHGRKVTLIGWSLGGIYARELAREHADAVRSVITLGSPYRMTLGDRSNASPFVDPLVNGFDAEFIENRHPEREREPLPVPATSIYSRTDGIVRWPLCIDDVGPGRENIEVFGSHTGLAVNPAVLYAIAHRLRVPEDDWQPFSAPGVLRPWYPAPASWSEDRARRRTTLTG